MINSEAYRFAVEDADVADKLSAELTFVDVTTTVDLERRDGGAESHQLPEVAVGGLRARPRNDLRTS